MNRIVPLIEDNQQNRCLATFLLEKHGCAAMAGDRETALASGCHGYIGKAIGPHTLISEVARFLPQEAQ